MEERLAIDERCTVAGPPVDGQGLVAHRVVTGEHQHRAVGVRAAVADRLGPVAQEDLPQPQQALLDEPAVAPGDRQA